MMQKPWFKTFIWFMATSFFFFASTIIISALSPGPSQTEVIQFMAGMMKAMENSLMGLAMMLEHDSNLLQLINFAVMITPPLIVTSILAGILVRWKNRDA